MLRAARSLSVAPTREALAVPFPLHGCGEPSQLALGYYIVQVSIQSTSIGKVSGKMEVCKDLFWLNDPRHTGESVDVRTHAHV